jgi:hypothetical protein
VELEFSLDAAVTCAFASSTLLDSCCRAAMSLASMDLISFWDTLSFSFNSSLSVVILSLDAVRLETCFWSPEVSDVTAEDDLRTSESSFLREEISSFASLAFWSLARLSFSKFVSASFFPRSSRLSYFNCKFSYFFVNSFTGVDLSDPVSGLVNVPKLLESNNLICFALEFVKLAAPSYTNNIFTTLAAPLNLLFDALSVPLLSLACPQFDALTQSGQPLWEVLQEKFPGAEKTAL